MKYLTNVGLVPIVNYPDLWYVEKDLVWLSKSGVMITTPAGMISDDASIPKALDWIPFLDRQGRSRRPGLTHDSCYSLGRGKGKDFADSVLLEACMDEGLSSFESKIIYEGVHEFGQSSWDADRGEGIFGEIKSGNFITQYYYEQWLRKGATLFS